MRKKFFDSFLAFSLTLALVFTASALPASAAEKVIYAKSLDGKYEYTSIQTAWDAVKKGGTIVMRCDWNLSDSLELDDNEKGTVYMNGYKINRGLTSSERDGEVIYLDEGSSLTLKGCNVNGKNIAGTEFKIEGQDLNGKTSGTITSGGLITGGYSTNGAGGIHMKGNASLTLDNVIVGGNKVSNNYGGGVNMNNTECSLTLQNGAAITYNVATYGGGVYVAKSSCNISLSGGSTIAYNYARESGGGIYSNASYTTVELTESSSISNNIAYEDGGAYYGNYSYNTIESSDNTGSMSNNVANHAGGAIFLDSVTLGGNKNSISGICFDRNSCLSSNGGAMYLAQESITVRDCIIKNNSAHWGGGVYNINDNNTFANCTITNNRAEGYGGGIYQGLYNNIKLSDKVIIKNNTRADGALDDLYLAEAWLSAAYTASKPAAGSEIGIKTYAVTSERKIGEDTEFDETMFFSDTQGYYIRYDSAEKELYLTSNDSNNTSYSVTVNGKVQGYYNAGAKLTIDGTPSDSSKVFKEWNGGVDALDSNNEKTKAVASVSMKPRDLTFTADYVTKASDFTLTVAKPVAGNPLLEEGTLSWMRGRINESRPVTVYWLVQNGTTTQTASGTADYNTKYSVAAVIDADPSDNLAFADTVTGTVIYTDTDGKNQTNKVYVDDTQSTLYMYGNQILTEKASIESVENVTVNVKKGSTEAELKALLPTTAVVYGEDGKAYIVNTDVNNAILSTAVTNGTVNASGGSVTIPLKLDGTEEVKNGTGEAEKKLIVTVNVVETINGTLAAPTANAESGTYKDKGNDGKVTQNIKLTAEDGASIHYKVSGATYEVNKVNNNADFATYDSDAGITLSAAAGTKESFTVQTYADGKDGYARSTVATYTYVLDNPYTVTITKKSTASQDGTDVIGDVYTAQYYKDDKVIIGAPIVEEYTFDRWQKQTEDEKGITIDDSNAQNNTLTVEKIEGNISLAALYNPIVKPVEIEPDTPAEPDTSHGSTGTYKKPDSTADTTIDQTETVKAKVATLELKARSSKTAKKNIKVVLKMSDEAQATIDEIQSLGYTVKYKFYRSTKKASSYEAKLEKDTKTYINTAGKKGTHYYYKARVKVYDSEGKLVTYTSLKQCKYAARIFG